MECKIYIFIFFSFLFTFFLNACVEQFIIFFWRNFCSEGRETYFFFPVCIFLLFFFKPKTEDQRGVAESLRMNFCVIPVKQHWPVNSWLPFFSVNPAYCRDCGWFFDIPQYFIKLGLLGHCPPPPLSFFDEMDESAVVSFLKTKDFVFFVYSDNHLFFFFFFFVFSYDFVRCQENSKI